MVSGILAIWKSGGGYVPLDPDYPGERLLYMLEDSAPIALLTQAHLKERFGQLPATLPTIDLTDASAWSHQPDCNPERGAAGLTSQHLAYVIYTSGSTGRPKGVLVEHANVVRLFAATHAWFRMGDVGSTALWRPPDCGFQSYGTFSGRFLPAGMPGKDNDSQSDPQRLSDIHSGPGRQRGGAWIAVCDFWRRSARGSLAAALV